MMPNTITNSTAITPTNTSATLALIVKARSIEPNTMNGLRRNSRKKRFVPFCT